MDLSDLDTWQTSECLEDYQENYKYIFFNQLTLHFFIVKTGLQLVQIEEELLFPLDGSKRGQRMTVIS